jgi:uncharacterized protein YecE (DUF72 family)
VSRQGSLHVGTSGWNYKHWRGPFYPDDLSSKRWLEYYVDRLSSVEINNSFYNLPETKTLKAWNATTPKSFLFTAKVSRYLTHMKKLKDPAEPLRRFLDRMQALESKLGPILFQLPPRWKCNPDRLAGVLERLPNDRPAAFEFRDESWWCDAVYALLRQHNAALCIFDLAGTTSPKEITADFTYLRLHGPGDKYQGQYGKRGLSGWAGAISNWRTSGVDCYCYFDNDDSGYAAMDALALQEMLT